MCSGCQDRKVQKNCAINSRNLSRLPLVLEWPRAIDPCSSVEDIRFDPVNTGVERVFPSNRPRMRVLL